MGSGLKHIVALNQAVYTLCGVLNTIIAISYLYIMIYCIIYMYIPRYSGHLSYTLTSIKLQWTRLTIKAIQVEQLIFRILNRYVYCIKAMCLLKQNRIELNLFLLYDVHRLKHNIYIVCVIHEKEKTVFLRKGGLFKTQYNHVK